MLTLTRTRTRTLTPNPNPNPDPDPDPDRDPNSSPNPNPTPDPDPNPNPSPTLDQGDMTLQSLDGQTKTIKDTLQEQKGVTYRRLSHEEERRRKRPWGTEDPSQPGGTPCCLQPGARAARSGCSLGHVQLQPRARRVAA